MTKCQCGNPPVFLSDRCARCCSPAEYAIAKLYAVADERGRRRVVNAVADAVELKRAQSKAPVRGS